MRRRQQQPSSPPQQLTPDNGIDLTNELLELKALQRHHQSRKKYRGVQTEAPTRPAQQRWRPNRQQRAILEDFYAGNQQPSHQEISELTARVSEHGHVDESKVYYWFQNRKSRDKRKERRIEQEAAAAAAAAAAAGGSAGEGSSASAVGAAMQHPYDMTAGAANLYPSASASSGSDQLQPLGPPPFAQIVIDGASFLETEATGLIDLATSFGPGAALFDPDLGRIVPTDERGVTLEPLQARTYNLVMPPCSPPPPPPQEAPGASQLSEMDDRLWSFP